MAESEIISILKSCIVSKKGGVPLKELDMEYEELAGVTIPFKRLGYDSLKTFLYTIPGIQVHLNVDGNEVLTMKSKKTAHISAMIYMQKSARPKVNKFNTKRVICTPLRRSVNNRPAIHSAKKVHYATKCNMVTTNNFSHKKYNHSLSSRNVMQIPQNTKSNHSDAVQLNIEKEGVLTMSLQNQKDPHENNGLHMKELQVPLKTLHDSPDVICDNSGSAMVQDNVSNKSERGKQVKSCNKRHSRGHKNISVTKQIISNRGSPLKVSVVNDTSGLPLVADGDSFSGNRETLKEQCSRQVQMMNTTGNLCSVHPNGSSRKITMLHDVLTITVDNTNSSSLASTATMVNNTLTVTVDNTGSSCFTSVMDGTLPVSKPDVEALNTKLEQLWIDDENEETFLPIYNNYQMLGDDFFLHIADKSLSYTTERKRGAARRCGLCISGQTIYESYKRVKKLPSLHENVVILLGAIDVLERMHLADMQEDMVKLLRVLRKKGVKSVLLLTIPPLLNINENRFRTLLGFNRWLQQKWFGDAVHVVDVVPSLTCSTGALIIIYYEDYTRHARHTHHPIIVWNKLGRDCILQVIKYYIQLQESS